MGTIVYSKTQTVKMALIKGKASESVEAPQSHSQPSRKGKKAWRKNVDVTDVQKGLAELNDEIITGGVVREKENEALFTVDTKPSQALVKRPSKVPSKKTLKADEIIAARSAVPAVSSRKRSRGKTTDGLLPAKRQRTDWVSHKDLARLKRVADGQHDNTIEVKDATYDLWDAPKKEEDPMNFLPEKVEAKVPKSMRQPTISLLANGKPAPAVQRPTDVYSYMPDDSKWEEHLAQEGQRALEAEKKRL